MISLFGKSGPSLLERLKQSVSKTRTELSARVEQLLTGNRPVAIVGMPLSLKSENQSSDAVIKPLDATIFVGTKSRCPKPR